MAAAAGDLTKTQCMGCGKECGTTLNHMIHVSICDLPPVRPRYCPACATENWKRTLCRECGRAL